MIVRISRGFCQPDQFDDMHRMLDESGRVLVAAIEKLAGCRHYYAGADRVSSSMVNVSIWDTLEHATQMAGLAEMQELAQKFRARGIRFEAIVNYETVWEVGS